MKTSEELQTWLLTTLASVLRSPRMYGESEAVEMQVLMLLDVLAVLHERSDRETMEAHAAYVKMTGFKQGVPLCRNNMAVERLVTHLKEIANVQLKRMGLQTL